jgi:DNA polymerase-1
MTITQGAMTRAPRILSCDEVCSFLENMGEDDVVACDTEGTNIDWDYRDGRGFGTGISLAFRFGELLTGYYPFGHPSANITDEEAYRLRNALRNFKGWLVFHNSKHDLVALRTLGIEYTGKFYDTMLLCHLLNETLPYTKSLSSCVAHYLGEGYAKDDAEVKAVVAALNGEWHKVPASIMASYAIHDAVLTLNLFEIVAPRIFKEMPREYWDHKQDFIRVIIAMEARGVRVNVDLCKHMTAIGEVQLAEVVELLGLNPGSPKDQYELFIERLGLPIIEKKRSKKTNKPSFDKEVMELYEEILERKNDPTAELFLQYRGWQKAVSSNYKPYVNLLSPDGRLRPNYKLHGTKTGRMSCEKPNLQQIPRVSNKPWNGKMKQCFIPADGYTLWEFDYSQLEFRLGTAYAAQYQPDIPLVEIFADPTRDVFTEMSKMENWPRQDIKTRTYTVQFGGGAQRLSDVFGVSLEEGARIRDGFFSMYPGFNQVTKMAKSKAKGRGKLQLWSGRYRHFMFPESEAHKAFNAVIQGGAADIMNHVMVRLFKEVDDDVECRMLLQVHDSVVFEIKNGCEDEYLPRIKEVMEDVRPDFGVVFKVDGHKWGEG